MNRFKDDAARIVNFVLNEETDSPPSVPPMRIPVRIQHPDGTISDAEFTGYYTPDKPSIGYQIKGGMTHGMLRTGDKLLTPVPSYDRWFAWLQRKRKEAVVKARTQRLKTFPPHPPEVSLPSYGQARDTVKDAFS